MNTSSSLYLPSSPSESSLEDLFDCPNKRGDFACGSPSCPWCGYTQATKRAVAMGRQGPLTMITFTQLGLNWDEAREKMKAVKRYLDRRLSLAWAWVREPFQSNLDTHVHAWTKGEIPDEDLLQEAAISAGMGERIHISPPKPNFRKGEDTSKTYYAFKGILTPPQGSTSSQEGLQSHLTLNGDRLLHSSRDFFQDAQGRTQSLSEAIKVKDAEPNGNSSQEPARAYSSNSDF